MARWGLPKRAARSAMTLSFSPARHWLRVENDAARSVQRGRAAPHGRARAVAAPQRAARATGAGAGGWGRRSTGVLVGIATGMVSRPLLLAGLPRSETAPNLPPFTHGGEGQDAAPCPPIGARRRSSSQPQEACPSGMVAAMRAAMHQRMLFGCSKPSTRGGAARDVWGARRRAG